MDIECKIGGYYIIKKNGKEIFRNHNLVLEGFGKLLNHKDYKEIFNSSDFGIVIELGKGKRLERVQDTSLQILNKSLSSNNSKNIIDDEDDIIYEHAYQVSWTNTLLSPEVFSEIGTKYNKFYLTRTLLRENGELKDLVVEVNDNIEITYIYRFYFPKKSYIQYNISEHNTSKRVTAKSVVFLGNKILPDVYQFVEDDYFKNPDGSYKYDFNDFENQLFKDIKQDFSKVPQLIYINKIWREIFYLRCIMFNYLNFSFVAFTYNDSEDGPLIPFGNDNRKDFLTINFIWKEREYEE